MTLFDTSSGVPRLRPHRRWSDNVIDMYSSDSDDNGEAHTCDQGSDGNSRKRECGFQAENGHVNSQPVSHSRLRRNPHFPYESLFSPRVAWGERPREAWSEHQDQSMYDSLNPYALFNLPRSDAVKKDGSLSKRRSTDISGRERHSREDLNSDYASNFHSIHSCGDLGMDRMNERGISPSTDGRLGIEHGSHPSLSELNRLSPQPSTSSGVGGGEGDRMRVLSHSKLYHPFSSQESMDTNSDIEDSSDTDVDIVSVNFNSVTPDSRAGPYVVRDNRTLTCVNDNSVQCDVKKSAKNKTHTCIQGNLGVVRPKAIKLESGQKFLKSNTNSGGNVEITNASYNGSSENLAGNIATRNISDESTIPSTNNDLPSSESRILHMVPNPQVIKANAKLQNPTSKVICNNPSRHGKMPHASCIRKSLKDMHNSVIKGCSPSDMMGAAALPKAAAADTGRSIDLTMGDTDDLNIETEVSGERVDSPIIAEVQLPSASDDSDIEVVRIETNR